MQPWISLANVIGDLLGLAAAVTDLAAARARARRGPPPAPPGQPRRESDNGPLSRVRALSFHTVS